MCCDLRLGAVTHCGHSELVRKADIFCGTPGSIFGRDATLTLLKSLLWINPAKVRASVPYLLRGCLLYILTLTLSLLFGVSDHPVRLCRRLCRYASGSALAASDQPVVLSGTRLPAQGNRGVTLNVSQVRHPASPPRSIAHHSTTNECMTATTIITTTSRNTTMGKTAKSLMLTKTISGEL